MVEHILKSDLKLQKSNPSGVSNKILDGLLQTQSDIAQAKDDGFKTAVLHITADILHVGHIDYIEEANRKLRELLGAPHKLFVGVESDQTTANRKAKNNIYNEDERKRIMESLKGVDGAFISFSGATDTTKEDRPYGTTLFLEPDVLVSHEEYFPNQVDEQPVHQKMQENNGQFLCIKESERLQPSMRDQLGRSTTNTIKQILSLYSNK